MVVVVVVVVQSHAFVHGGVAISGTFYAIHAIPFPEIYFSSSCTHNPIRREALVPRNPHDYLRLPRRRNISFYITHYYFCFCFLCFRFRRVTFVLCLRIRHFTRSLPCRRIIPYTFPS